MCRHRARINVACMRTNQPNDVSWVGMKINFGKFFGTKRIKKTRGDLCSKLFGVALIKLRSYSWTPNRRQLSSLLLRLRVLLWLRSLRWLLVDLCLRQVRLVLGALVVQVARIRPLMRVCLCCWLG